MDIPSFLGIGAQRSGSTWLHRVLASHPQIYVPDGGHKELKFFSHNYPKGLDWYRNHFPTPAEAERFRAIGEVTPGYMLHPDVPSRIHQHQPRCKFIAILRHPVDRAFSQYTRALRNRNVRCTFEEFLMRNPDAVQRGLYGEHLGRFLTFFPPEQFLVFIFETLMQEPQSHLPELASFLEVDPNQFDDSILRQRMNASYLPRFPGVFASAVRLRRYLLQRNWGIVVRAAGASKISRVFKLFGPRKSLPRLDPDLRTEMFQHYRKDIDVLENLLDVSCSVWDSEDTVRAG